MLQVGTSGFQYDDWRGAWYPPRLPRARAFDYYAERFSAVEINSTFYHIYSPRMMASLVRRAAGRVTFAAKMSEYVTHRGMLGRAIVNSYAAGLEPAANAGVLAAVLLQFPQRFHWNPGKPALSGPCALRLQSFPSGARNSPPVLAVRRGMEILARQSDQSLHDGYAPLAGSSAPFV